MVLDIFTITFMGSIVQISLTILIFLQYKMNRYYKGIGLWFIGSVFLSFSFMFMFLYNNDKFWKLSILGNPFLILGQILLYLGILKFFEMKIKKYLLVIYGMVSIGLYFYYIFYINDTVMRSVVISLSLVVISLATAYKITHRNNKIILSTAKFLGNAFLFYGIFNIVRVLILLNSPLYASHDIYIHSTFNIVAYTIQIVISILCTFGFVIMVNQRLNNENIEEKEKLKVIFNTSPDAKLITRMLDGSFLDVNKGFIQMTGYSREEILTQSSLSLEVWESSQERELFLKELNENLEIENKEFVFRRKNGSNFVGLLSSRIITTDGDKQIVSVIHDITNRKKAEQEIRESKELYLSIINSSPDDITIAQMDGSILMVSPAGKKMFGFEANVDELSLNLNIMDFLDPEFREKARDKQMKMLQGEVFGPSEYMGIRLDGTKFDIEVNTAFIRDIEGKPIKIVLAIRDISERKEAEAKIQELILQLEIEKNAEKVNSITDSLTGIANRRYFDEILNKEFYRLKRSGAPLSLIMLDVDYFKKYNDTYGHLAGDNCLKQIGNILKNSVGRVYDSVTRYGGEEFGIILPETSLEGAITLAESIKKSVEDLKIIHEKSEINEYITVSLGVTTLSTVDIESVEEIIERADKALYRAKSNGRNRVEIY